MERRAVRWFFLMVLAWVVASGVWLVGDWLPVTVGGQ